MTSQEKYRPFLFAGLLLSLAVAPRLFLLGNHSLWLDESASLNTSASGLGQILGNVYRAHPPLYYLLLHFWLALGSSEVTLRLPSAILGALSIPLVYALARIWCTERVAFLGALLLALSPLHIWYSQEARMYSLLTFFGLLSTLSLSLVLKKGGWTWWLAYVASTLAGLYTHYGMLGLLLGENLWLAACWATRQRKPRFLLSWISSQAVLALGFLPWLPVLIDNVGGPAGLESFVILRLESLWSRGLAASLTAAFASLIILIAVALALWLNRTRPGTTPLKDVGLIFTGFVLYPLLTVSSAFPQGVSLKRQLMVELPYFFLLAAAGQGNLQRGRNLAATFMVLLAFVSLAASYTQRETEDWRGPARLVEAAGQTGDVILFHAAYTEAPFDFYYRGTLPRVKVAQDLDRQLAEVQAKYQRAWVVLSHDTYEDPEGKLRRWVAERWILQADWSFAGVEVRLYNTGDVGSPKGVELFPYERQL